MKREARIVWNDERLSKEQIDAITLRWCSGPLNFRSISASDEKLIEDLLRDLTKLLGHIYAEQDSNGD